MISSIQLENFKAFGQRTIIPLAPITLIFGQNSSGKSSILQSLNLLKQTRESRDVEALLLPRTENGLVDLGSFQEMLFDHDLKRKLSIRLDITLDKKKPQFHSTRPYTRDAKTLGLELSFNRKKLSDEITLEGFKFCSDKIEIAEFEKCQMPVELQHFVGPSYRSGRRHKTELMRAAQCKQISSDPSYWKPFYERSVNAKGYLIKILTEARQKLYEKQDTPLMRGLFDDDEQAGEGGVRLLASLNDHFKFVSSEFSFDDYVQRMIHEQLNAFVALDGFIPILSGRPDWELGMSSILNRVLGWQRFSRRDWSVDIGASSVYAGQVIGQALGGLFPLGPFRKPPSRWYIFTGTTPRDVGYQGHLLPDLLFRNNDLLKSTNEWLKALEIGYEIKLQHLGERSSDLFELLLLDTRRKSPAKLGLSDVGFGISQILPFVVQSLAACNQIISVEQPEVHIHPRLQADLGDLLIEAIKEPRRNQFIIETHSEHLALRLQRRVREKKLSPDEISFVYVDRGTNGSTVQSLRLDDQGDFIDDFPGGFFPERLRELR